MVARVVVVRHTAYPVREVSMSWRDKMYALSGEEPEPEPKSEPKAAPRVAGEALSTYYFGESEVPLQQRPEVLPHDAEYVPAWDPQYEPDAVMLEKLALCVLLDLPVLTVGPRGSGKTSAIIALAASIGQPVRRINMNGQTRSRDFVGYRNLEYEETIENGETVVRQTIGWVDGILPAALRAGHWLIIDELDAAPPGVLFALQSVLEPERTLYLPENGGEVVRPPGFLAHATDQDGNPYPREQQSSFRVFGTANTIGLGDDSGFYAGTNLINAATLDRFVVISADYPAPALEAKIVSQRGGLSDVDASSLVMFAGKIRDAVEKDACSITVSTRQLIAWAKMLSGLNECSSAASGDAIFAAVGNKAVKRIVALSYEMSIGGKLPEDDVAFYAGVLQREFDVRLGSST